MEREIMETNRTLAQEEESRERKQKLKLKEALIDDMVGTRYLIYQHSYIEYIRFLTDVV